MDFINWSGVECLNQSKSHSVANALKQVRYVRFLGVCVRINDIDFVIFEKSAVGSWVRYVLL